MLFTLLLMGIFLMIAIIFSLGKGSSLIAGYNTMSEEEKAQYDRVALTKFMGKVMFVLVFSMSFWVLSEWFQVEWRSEEHTSELQSRFDLVCRLLLEKKKERQGAQA